MCIVLIACLLSADDDGAPLKGRASQTLRTALDAMAAQARNGAWPTAWSPDGSVVWGQAEQIRPTGITVQPPATPSTASIYVAAARVLREPRYLDIARAARDALLKVQTPHGGFSRDADPTRGRSTQASFDDDTTTGALKFLMALHDATGDETDRQAVESIGEFILKAQYKETGGWPQRYPPPWFHYGADITFNDNAMANIIDALLRLHRLFGDDRYLDAAKLGGDCIIRLQGGPGEAVWAQQYDPKTLKPSKARPFEPPGYSACESVAICDRLIGLYLATGEERFLDPLPKAFAWYDTHKLPNGQMARLYEPGTERPIYGTAWGWGTYDVSEARPGYGWQADWYPRDAKRAYDRIAQVGRAAYAKEISNERKQPRRVDPDNVKEVCDALTTDGFWLRQPTDAQQKALRKTGVPVDDRRMIDTADFCNNAELLLRYLVEDE